MEKICECSVCIGSDVYRGEYLKSGGRRLLSRDDESQGFESWSRSSLQRSRKRCHAVLESDDEISGGKPKKNRTGYVSKESDDDEEVSSDKLKKNRTGDESVESDDEEISSRKFKKNRTGYVSKESDDDEEVSSDKLKKNRTGDESVESDDEEISSRKFKKNRTGYVSIESDDEEEKISSFKLKKNRTGDESVESDDEIFSRKPKKNRTGYVSIESDNDEESSSHKLKKNRTGERSGCNFLYSFVGLADEEKQLYASHSYAQPLIRSVWTGTFDVWHDESIYHRRRYCFSAYLSSKACKEARDAAFELEPVLQFEVLPVSRVWPKSFHGSGPTDADIAVYFFPALMKHESVYDSLVFEMIGDDLAMRAFVQGSELLIFTSIDLPLQFREFQGKRYLWGVFKDKRAPVDM